MPEKKSLSQKILAQQWLWGPLGIAIAILVALFFIIYIFRNVIFEPGLAPGADVASFAHTAAYIIDYLKIHHHLPAIDPNWYAGFELMHAPPLVNYVLGTIYYFTGNIELSTRILHPLGLAILFGGMFWFLKKEKSSTIAAWLGGLIFIFTPVIYGTIESYTKLIALFFLPFAFYLTNKVLTTTQIKYVVYLSIAVALPVYAHPMNGFVLGASLAIYAVIYAILDRQIITRRFFIVILAVVLGFLLSSRYLVPFMLERAAQAGVASRAELNPHFGEIIKYLANWLGGVFILITFFTTWRLRQAKITALFLTGIFTSLISLGYYYGIDAFFPFSQVYYYIWLFIAALCFSFILGLTVDIIKIKNLAIYFLKFAIAIVLFIAFFEFVNFTSLGVQRLTNYSLYASSSDKELVDELNQFSNPGRLYLSHYPFGQTNWIISQATDKKNVEGHYYAITRMNKHIANIADAIHNRYYDYPINKLKYYNVRYFLGNQYLRDIKDYQEVFVGREFVKRLTQKGFKFIFQSSQTSTWHYADYWLYFQDKPSTYLMPIEEKVLIIGKYKPTLAAALSPKVTAIESGSDYLDDYSPEFLKNFDTVILYGFTYHDKMKAEKIAREYTNEGGNLVIELFGISENPLAGNPSFLGVSGYSYNTEGPVQFEIQSADSKIKELPKTFTLPGEIQDSGIGFYDWQPLKEWNSLEYVGLDDSLVKLANEEKIYSILGYKNIEGGGKVTFVGMNLFYHLYLTHDQGELNCLSSIIANQNYPSSSSPTPLITQKKFDANNLQFDINASADQLFLLSLAYSPHWNAYLNGQKIKVWNLEDLMVMQIPAGSYTLEMKYKQTPVSYLGLILSIVTFLGLIGWLIWERIRLERF